MINYTIYSPFLLLCVFWVFLQIRIYKFKHVWLEDVLRSCGSKKIAKRGPKWPIGKAHGPEKAQNAALEKRRRLDWPKATTARGGGGTAVRPGWHGYASPLSPICNSRLCLFVFLRILFSVFVVLPLKERVYGHLGGDSCTPFHSPFSIFFSF